MPPDRLAQLDDRLRRQGPRRTVTVNVTSIARAASIALALSVGVLSLLPAEAAVSSNISDKLDHLVAYATLSLAAVLGWRGRWSAVQVALACAAYGAGLELAQSLSPGRAPELLDALANCLGALAGSGAATLARRVRI